MYTSDPCQECNLPREVVQTLFEKIESCYWLIQALIHLGKDKHISFTCMQFSIYPLQSKS